MPDVVSEAPNKKADNNELNNLLLQDLEKFESANSNFITLRHNRRLEARQKTRWVEQPLEYVTDKFKKLPDYLGLTWCINRLPTFNLPFKIIEPLGLTYSKYSSGFILAPVTYVITPLNFWAVGLHYGLRQLAKTVGWLLVSPFTIPAYLGIKAYYGIKHAIANHKINSTLKKIAPQHLAQAWCTSCNTTYSNTVPLRIIAKHVPPQEFIAGFKAYRAKIKAEGKDDRLTLHDTYDEYSKAREKALKSERNWSLFKTILSGIFIVPLLWTYPKHKKLIQRHEEEKSNGSRYNATVQEIFISSFAIPSSNVVESSAEVKPPATIANSPAAPSTTEPTPAVPYNAGSTATQLASYGTFRAPPRSSSQERFEEFQTADDNSTAPPSIDNNPLIAGDDTLPLLLR